MPDLLDIVPVDELPAARAIAALIASGAPVSRRDLNAALTAVHGGSDADGRWTQRDSFEFLEHALALHLVSADFALTGFGDVTVATALMERLPTQTVRSEEQLDLQQFSTPADIAAIAVLLAAIGANDVVLEPSAGNGLLVAQAPTMATLQLNELDPKRRARLASIFPAATITGHDAAALVSLHASLPRPTVVLMNPSFARSLGRGADDLAAMRHLQAAIRRVAPGGRVVAVMPDWFTPSARVNAAYEAVLTGCTVRTSLRLENCYRKHGTSIAVRLYVIDKVPGTNTTVTIQRSSVTAFLDVLEVPARAALVGDTSSPKPAVQKPALFGAARSTKVAAPRPFHAPVRNNVQPVAYQTLPTPAPLAEQVGVYLPYRPSRIIFDAAGNHPTALVESVAMGSIPAPIPAHVPHLPERTVTERLLSSSQLETVVYAGHAWTQLIPGSFVPAKEGVGLTIDAAGRRYRKGFFLGDGTGAGKGRQVAACILDSWLAGRRRHIWVSKNEPLLEDARRDWTALGGLSADVHPLSSAPASTIVGSHTARDDRGEAGAHRRRPLRDVRTAQDGPSRYPDQGAASGHRRPGRQLAPRPPAGAPDHYRRSRETARELTVARVRKCRHDDDLARVEQMLIEARSGWLYDLDRAFTRAERGELLVEVRNRRRLLELGRAAPKAKAKGARFDIARLPQQALDRLIQSHPDAGLVEHLREERFRRTQLYCNDIGTTSG